MPYPSGTARKLETGGLLTATSWFPDGRHLLVAPSDKGALSTLDVIDGTRRTIASGPNAMHYPAVSPDGKRIAYGNGAAGWDVIEVSIPGGDVRTLVSGGAHGGPIGLPPERTLSMRPLKADDREWRTVRRARKDSPAN